MIININKKIIRYIVFTLTLSLISVYTYANAYANTLALNIEKSLDAVEKNYAKMDSFKAEFSQELFHRESDTIQKRTGTLLFEQTNNIRWTTKAPNAEEIIVNKKEIWNYLPDEEIAYKYGPKMLEQSHIALSVITGNTKIIDNFEVEMIATTGTEKEDNFLKLLLFPFEPSTNLVEAELWIDTKENLIKKIVISDFYSNTNSIYFETFKANAKVRKKDFSFEPPKGVTVEDQTDK